MKTRFQTYLFILTILLLTACGQSHQETESNNPPPLSNYNLPANIQKSTKSVIAGTIDVATVTEPFNMIISANPKFYSWRNGNCTPETPQTTVSECITKRSLQANVDQYFAMRSFANRSSNWIWPNSSNLATTKKRTVVTKPVGLIINGDLAGPWNSRNYNYNEPHKAYFLFYKTLHSSNFDHRIPMYRNIMELIDSMPINNNDIIKGLSKIYNFYPGLGDWDFSNDSGCQYLYTGPVGSIRRTFAINRCGSVAASQIIRTVKSVRHEFHHVPNTRIGYNKLPYYFDIGNHRFIQLHNYPGYTTNSLTEGAFIYQIGSLLFTEYPFVTQSYSWLRNVLATSRNKRIVINMHDYATQMAGTNAVDFLGAIENSRENIVGIFAGGVEDSVGKIADLPCNSGVSSCSEIPVFRSGSAEYGTFLVAEFGSNSMSVGTIQSTVWTMPERVATIAGTTVGEKTGMNAVYISNADCPRFGDRTYVVWNSQGLSNTSVDSGNHSKVSYQSFRVDASNPVDVKIVASDARAISNANAANAPAIAALDGKMYVFWQNKNDQSIEYSSANCNASSNNLNWSRTQYLSLSGPRTVAVGLAARKYGNNIFMIYPRSTNLPNPMNPGRKYRIGKISLTFFRNYGVPTVIRNPILYTDPAGTGLNTVPQFWIFDNNMYITYRMDNVIPRLNRITHYTFSIGMNIKNPRNNLPYIRYSHNTPIANYVVAAFAIESLASGQVVSIQQQDYEGDVSYIIHENVPTSPSRDVPAPKFRGYNQSSTIVSSRKNMGYIGRGMVKSRHGGLALARSNDPSKLIAFYRDAQNNDLYASVFLGKPRFMRSTTNSVDANLLKTYYK